MTLQKISVVFVSKDVTLKEKSGTFHCENCIFSIYLIAVSHCPHMEKG
jgi:hypothetical protein